MYHEGCITSGADLNFKPFIAPLDFDRTAQNVDIFAEFSKLYAQDQNYSYIARVVDGSQYIYAQHNGDGMISYIENDVRVYNQITAPDCRRTAISSTPITELLVNSTAGFLDSGVVYDENSNLFFTYTSKLSDRFIGPSQSVNAGTFYTGTNHIRQAYSYSSINRTSGFIASKVTGALSFLSRISDWIYVGPDKITDLGISTTTGRVSTCKHIHCHSLEQMLRNGLGYYAFISNNLTGTITLPNIPKIAENGYVGYYAISATNITGEFVIPDKVTDIKLGINTNCTSLRIDSQVLSTISTVIGAPITGSVTIPASVTYLVDKCFTNNQLTSIISNSSTYISEDDVLYRLGSGTKEAMESAIGKVATLTLANNCTSINAKCFYNSKRTGSLSIPASITSLGDSAFYGCSGLTGNLVIPNTITSMSTSVFRGCTGFTGTLSILTSLTAIPDYTFYGCSGLTGNLVIPNTVTSIGYAAFYTCTHLTGSISLPSGLTTIGASAFQGCTLLTSLSLPSSLTNIGSNAFYGCSGIQGTITIPSSVTSIGSTAFYNSTSITGLVFETGGTSLSMGYAAFAGMTSLSGTVTLPSQLSEIGTLDNGAINGNPFYSSGIVVFSSLSANFNVYNNVLYSSDYTRLIGTCKVSGTAPAVHANTQKIDSYAFYRAYMTGVLDLPSGLKEIRYSAFTNNPGLTAIYFRSNKSVTGLAKDAPTIVPTPATTGDNQQIFASLGSNKIHAIAGATGYTSAPYSSYGTVTYDL